MISIAELRRHLIDVYRKEMCHLEIFRKPQFNPKFIDIYVRPQADIIIKDCPENKKQTFNSYNDLLPDQHYRRIYVSANAGMGKTAFAKKMALTWCQAWQSDQTQVRKFEEEDIKVMKRFDLLFFIELSKTKTLTNNIIVDLITEKLERRPLIDIDKMLKNCKCLIIFDDFYQWPHLKVDVLQDNRYQSCTFLTTSICKPTQREGEVYIELSYLTQFTSRQLQEKVIRHFHLYEENISNIRIRNELSDFESKAANAGLGQLIYVPDFLLQELGLWRKRRQSINKFEAYLYHIEQRLIKAYNDNLFDIVSVSLNVPDYIDGWEKFSLFYSHFLELGRIAYEKICKLPADATNVVLSVNNRGDLNVTYIAFFERVGILFPVKVTSNGHSFTFKESSMQELFVALYVVGAWNNLQKRVDIVKKFHRLSNMKSSILRFVRDMDSKFYEAIYSAVVNRKDTNIYLNAFDPERMYVSVYGGRYLQFEYGEMEAIVRDCQDKFAMGSFRPVYKTFVLKEKYGIFAVKKLELLADMETKIQETIEQERHASENIHPFLLPTMTILRSVSKTHIFYLLSPYCENGDLYEALHGSNKVSLSWEERLRIIFQVALAIEYLRRLSRKQVVHIDLRTKKIVLDREKNARLLDCNSVQTDTSTMTKPKDYKGLLDVSLELLTGKSEGLTDDNFRKLSYKLKKLPCPQQWKKDRRQFKWTSKLVAKGLMVGDSFSLPYFIRRIKRIYSKYQKIPMKCVDDKCVMCLVKAGAPSGNHSHSCCKSLKICISCQRRVYNDPFKCICCGCEQQRAPGKDCMALLLAGNDRSKNIARALEKDVEDMKKLLTFTAPPIVGVSEDVVKIVKPTVLGSDGEENEMKKKIITAITELKKISDDNKSYETLVVYFSCHGEADTIKSKKEDSHKQKCDNEVDTYKFRIGIENDLLELEELESLLNDLNVKRVIVLLDCCKPPEVKLKNIKTIQINASSPNDNTSVVACGSLFTRNLIETMIRQALKKSKDDSITAFTLFKHGSQKTECGIKPPVFYSPRLTPYEDEKIGCRFSDPILASFYFANLRRTIPVNRSMMELERDLFLAFRMDQENYSLTITRQPSNNHQEERLLPTVCSKIEDVVMAKVLGEDLMVDFRKIKTPTDFKTVKLNLKMVTVDNMNLKTSRKELLQRLLSVQLDKKPTRSRQISI